MRPKLVTQQVQRHILAPIMQKSISVLILPVAELNSIIEEELQANPLLEIDEANRLASAARDNEELREKIRRLSEISDGPVYQGAIGDEEESREKPLTKSATLEDYLMRQLRLEISNPEKLRIGEYIIGNLNEDGFFELPLDEASQRLGLSGSAQMQEVLETVKSFDPVGIASKDLKECLLAQLHTLAPHDEQVIKQVIGNHLEALGRKRFKEIAKSINISVDRVKEIGHYIHSLEPKPARAYRPIEENIYVKPDIFIRKTDNEFQITVNNEDIPTLRISPFYKELLRKPNLTEEEKTFIEERLQSALFFIKSIKQRSETLRAIVQFIVNKQAEFFENGHGTLAPLTLKDVAKVVERDESTISRTIRNKYIDTPYGIIPLKFFFSSAIATEANGHVGSRGIIEEIRQMIDEEDKVSPLSDQDIQNHFKEKGVRIARRTIAKYRNALKIPASHLRKE
ncbi:MAG: RNA polymerase factor sigma-54 [Candidatus Omnitrophota bacterium]